MPDKLPIGGADARKFASLEVENPLRGYAFQAASGIRTDYDGTALPFVVVAERNERFGPLLDGALAGAQRVLDAPAGLGRELVVLRIVSNADLADQTYEGSSALGFSTLHLTKKSDARVRERADQPRDVLRQHEHERVRRRAHDRHRPHGASARARRREPDPADLQLVSVAPLDPMTDVRFMLSLRTLGSAAYKGLMARRLQAGARELTWPSAMGMSDTNSA